MNNPMEYFYGDSAEVYEVISDGSYEPSECKLYIKTIECDIQPYGGDLSDAMRGLGETEKIKIFCDADEELQRGRYVKVGDDWYIITDVKKWRMGYEIIAERGIVQ